MTFYRHPSGLGGTAGDGRGYRGRVSGSSTVLYIDCATGRDDLRAGKTREDPLASLTYAVGYLESNYAKTYVLMPGHTESISSQVYFPYGHNAVLGEGDGDSMPCLRPALGGIGTYMLLGTDTHFSNVRFGESTVPGSWTKKVLSNGYYTSFDGCVFEQGDNDAVPVFSGGPGIYVNAFSDVFVSNCSFINTSIHATSSVGSGVYFAYGSAAFTSIGCTFDGGTVGWNPGAGVGSSYAAVLSNISSGPRVVRMHDTSFVNGAAATVHTGTMLSVTLSSSSSAGVIVVQ